MNSFGALRVRKVVDSCRHVDWKAQVPLAATILQFGERKNPDVNAFKYDFQKINPDDRKAMLQAAAASVKKTNRILYSSSIILGASAGIGIGDAALSANPENSIIVVVSCITALVSGAVAWFAHRSQNKASRLYNFLKETEEALSGKPGSTPRKNVLDAQSASGDMYRDLAHTVALQKGPVEPPSAQ